MGRRVKAGVLHYDAIQELIRKGHVRSPHLETDAQREKYVQSSSLDVLLAECVVRHLRASAPPITDRTVDDSIADEVVDTALLAERFYLQQPGENGCGIYVAQIALDLDLPDDVCVIGSGKSGAARDFMRMRIMGDGVHTFNYLPPGYKGKVFVEMTSNVFHGPIAAGLSLAQLRFVQGKIEDTYLTDDQIKALHRKHPLLYDGKGKEVDLKAPILDGGINSTADLQTSGAYIGKRGTPPLDFREHRTHNARDYFHEKSGDYVHLFKNAWALVRSLYKYSFPNHVAGQIDEMDTKKSDMFANLSTSINAGHGAEIPLPIIGEVAAAYATGKIRHGAEFSRHKMCRLLAASSKIYASSMDGMLSNRFDPKTYPWQK